MVMIVMINSSTATTNPAIKPLLTEILLEKAGGVVWLTDSLPLVLDPAPSVPVLSVTSSAVCELVVEGAGMCGLVDGSVGGFVGACVVVESAGGSMGAAVVGRDVDWTVVGGLMGAVGGGVGKGGQDDEAALI